MSVRSFWVAVTVLMILPASFITGDETAPKASRDTTSPPAWNDSVKPAKLPSKSTVLKQLRGTWREVDAQYPFPVAGAPRQVLYRSYWQFDDRAVTTWNPPELKRPDDSSTEDVFFDRYQVDASKHPIALDLIRVDGKGKIIAVNPGILEFDAQNPNRLRICFDRAHIFNMNRVDPKVTEYRRPPEFKTLIEQPQQLLAPPDLSRPRRLHDYVILERIESDLPATPRKPPAAVGQGTF